MELNLYGRPMKAPREDTGDEFQLFTCKCGELTGTKNHLKVCKLCKDKVTAKGRYYEIQTESNKS
tara:strand:+ start:14 stop:208 length:195 start_codon:yes stop_codon:yes gene_type:complete